MCAIGLVVVVVAISAVATMSQKRWCVQIYFLFFYEPIIISFPDGLVIYKILQIEREIGIFPFLISPPFYLPARSSGAYKFAVTGLIHTERRRREAPRISFLFCPNRGSANWPYIHRVVNFPPLLDAGARLFKCQKNEGRPFSSSPFILK